MQIVAPEPTPRAADGLAIERVGMERFGEIQTLNHAIFGESRVIYRLDRHDLLFLLASLGGVPVGFKVGYAESATTFYSAKGGVAAEARRRGIARALLDRMTDEARAMGYARLAFDTFPNKHPGMTVMGLAAGFTVAAAGYNATYRDYRLRFEQLL